MTSLLYDIFGLFICGSGIYFLVRSAGQLDVGEILSGIVTAAVGLLVLRTGVELIKVGAAARVAERRSESGRQTPG